MFVEMKLFRTNWGNLLGRPMFFHTDLILFSIVLAVTHARYVLVGAGIVKVV